jgi:hypothetical protein
MAGPFLNGVQANMDRERRSPKTFCVDVGVNIRFDAGFPGQAPSVSGAVGIARAGAACLPSRVGSKMKAA